MRYEWSLTLSGDWTPLFTQPARGMFLRRSKKWRNGTDGPSKGLWSWASMMPDTNEGVQIHIPVHNSTQSLWVGCAWCWNWHY